jgi:hypothetical protein
MTEKAHPRKDTGRNHIPARNHRAVEAEKKG